MAEPIAIVGMGCRLPGGVECPEDYWRLLIEGREAITETPSERWNLQQFYCPDVIKPGKTQSRWGGYVEGIDGFDPQLFGISPKEAMAMDPQQRMLLEASFRAVEDAGHSMASIQGDPVGVFVGISSFDYSVGALSFTDRGVIGPYTNTGGSSSIAANRISYAFDLRGPSLAIDTACSSSLVALHFACESLRRGEATAALVGGVNALLLPDFYVGFSQLGVLSPDGRCKTFDASANGYVRSEGAAVVLLKPLSAARRDGDRIYSVIRATATNQDGHTVGLTVPSGAAQTALVREACRKAGVTPAQIQYVEAHGTGTPVGDPIEANALGKVLGRDRQEPCWVGSVKTQIGHLEAGAGMASLLKVALGLHHQQIPAHLNLTQPHPEIDFERLRLRVPVEPIAWPIGEVPRLAGINGFGYGGANAHVIVEEAPQASPLQGPVFVGRRGQETPPAAAPRVLTPANRPGTPVLFPIAARSPQSLRQVASRWADWVDAQPPERTLAMLAGQAARFQNHFAHRRGIVADSRDQLWTQLQQIATGTGSGTEATETSASTQPLAESGLLFVCCGQGAQWWAMGRGLIEESELFRKTLQRCDREFSKHVYWSLMEELQREESASRMHETAIVQPSLFAIQVALAACWEAVGVRPAGVVGHSVGEIAAAYLAGALDFEAACQVAVERGRTMDRASASGAMIAAGMTEAEAQSRLSAGHPDVCIAAINGPTSLTLSGPAARVAALQAELERDGVFCKRLNIEYAFHSRLMEPVCEPLLAALPDLAPQATPIPLISTVTGQPIEGSELNAEYWWRNVRHAVRFADAIQATRDGDFGAVLEIGPHPVLTYAIDESLRAVDQPRPVVPSLRRDARDPARFLQSLARLYEFGQTIEWQTLFPEAASRDRSAPLYPFERQRLWAEGLESKRTRRAESHPLLGRREDSVAPVWRSRIDLNLQSSLADHRVRGAAMLPAAAMAETALAALRQRSKDQAVGLARLRFLQPCSLHQNQPLHLSTAVDVAQRRVTLSIRDAGGDVEDWQPLAEAEATSVPAPLKPLAESLEPVKQRCEITWTADACYAYAKDNGLDYGPGFRGLEEARVGDGEAWARIVCPAANRNEVQPGYLHPALLDSGFHTLVLAGKENPISAGQLYLPSQIERIVWLRPLAEQAEVHCRLTRVTEQSLTADLDFYDPQGRLSLQLRGFRSRRALQAKSRETLADRLFRFQWIEQPLEPASSPSAPVGFVVFECDQPLFGELADRLRDAGHRVIRVAAAETFRRDGRDAYAFDPAATDGVTKLFQQIDRDVPEEQTLHLVYGWGGLAPPMAAVNAASLRHSTVVTTEVPLRIVQAWESQFGRRPGHMTVVTQGAQTDETAIEPVAVAQGPLIGFARVIASEYGPLQTRLVDLPARDERPSEAFGRDLPERPQAVGLPAQSFQTLVAQLLSPEDREDEIMLRGRRRWVRRFLPHFDQPLPVTPTGTPARSQLRLGATHGVEDLQYRSCGRLPLGPRDVEIEVAATGLNFSDVMKVLDLYPGLPEGPLNLGAECAGRIVGVGRDVDQWEVGQQVLGIATAAFATHAIADARLLAAKPASLSDAEAASFPIAFLTAEHALRTCARIQPGETVLIHSASGGVGLAALQIAKRFGARILATAGSEAKRDYLRDLGVEAVYDSRSLEFADQIARMHPDGIDVVLNSLPGEALTRSLKLLRPGGRFLEIGKRDIYDDQPLGMYPLRNNLAVFAIDLDQLFKTQADRLGQLLRQLVGEVDGGALQPLPTRSWPAAETADAFKFMQQAKHIGKVAVTYDAPPQPVFPGNFAETKFRADATYWIVGGLGGFGLQVARWMAGRGARHLVLTGRRVEPTPEAAATIEAIRAEGTEVQLLSADVTKLEEVQRTRQRIEETLPPLRGVVHAAMVLEDRLLVDLDLETLQRVLWPKVLGGWNLHDATLDDRLDHFVLFSSLSSVFGHAGQANYSAANAALDSLAAFRRSQGLPGLAINWGHLGEVGYLSRREELGERLERQGVLAFSVEQAMEALDHVLASRPVQASVLRMDWSRWRGLGVTGDVSPRFAHLIRERQDGEIDATSCEQLRQLPEAERRQRIENVVATKIATLLGFADDALDRGRPLLELGLDSLMAVELRNYIENRFEVALAVSDLLRDARLDDLVGKVSQQVASVAAPNGSETVTAPPASRSHAEPRGPHLRSAGAPSDAPMNAEDAKGLLERLPDLPAEEVNALLSRMLQEQGPTADDAS